MGLLSLPLSPYMFYIYIYIYNYYFLAGEGQDFVLLLQQPSRALGIDFRAHERDFLQAFPVEGSSSKR